MTLTLGYLIGHASGRVTWLHHATLWLDMCDQFAEEHHMEWESQKSLTCSLSDLEHDTEVVYRACLIKRQDDKEVADSREAAAKQPPPE